LLIYSKRQRGEKDNGNINIIKDKKEGDENGRM